MIGKQYNYWTVLEYNQKRYKLKCQCKCGTIRYVQPSALINGVTKSCGCSSYYPLLNTKIGRLTILSYYDTVDNHKRMLCRCDCGKDYVINLRDLKKKNPTQSCGCLQQEERNKPYVDLTGKQFGEWTVLSYFKNSKWHCKCSCGNERYILTNILNSGQSQSCGKCYEHKVNSNYFDNIDTEEKAYILGLLYADGYNNEKSNLIRLDLQKDDADILIKIKNIMEFQGDIKYYQNKNKIFKITGSDKEYKCKPTARLLIHNSRISNQLALKGCTNNKTYNITFPDSTILPIELHRHFIRGLVDGDGNIGYWIDNKNTQHKKFNFGLTGTTEIINTISHIISEKFNCKPDVRSRYPDRNNNNVTLSLCGNKIIEKTLNWLYQDSTIFLNRKYDKYLELLQQNLKTNNKELTDRKGIYTPRKVINLLNNIIYQSCSEAGRNLNVKPCTITGRCKNHNSFIYYEDEYLLLSENQQYQLKQQINNTYNKISKEVI